MVQGGCRASTFWYVVPVFESSWFGFVWSFVLLITWLKRSFSRLACGYWVQSMQVWLCSGWLVLGMCRQAGRRVWIHRWHLQASSMSYFVGGFDFNMLAQLCFQWEVGAALTHGLFAKSTGKGLKT